MTFNTSEHSCAHTHTLHAYIKSIANIYIYYKHPTHTTKTTYCESSENFQ